MQTPSTLRRLKTTEVAATRQAFIAAQGGRCALCQLTIVGTGVLDHDHSTGAVRAALHSGCNSLLGKVENNYKRYGVPNLGAFAHGVAAYVTRHAQNQTGLLHPTHKTDDEKRIRRNTLAKKARATKKATA